MKIKPEDFVVEEISNAKITSKGNYSIYRLWKRDLDMLKVLRIISSKLKVDYKGIKYAGLKDKKALTSQIISIENGKNININEENIRLKFLGYSENEIKTGDLIGNRFIITLRDLNEEKINRIKENLEEVKKYGIINYFDSQRFGSLKNNEFIAKYLIKKQWESALRLYFISIDKTSKLDRICSRFVIKNWNSWLKCYNFCSQYRGKLRFNPGILKVLTEKNDFLTAFKLIDMHLKELFISAYQSYLWNEAVKEYLKSKTKEIIEVKYAAGILYFCKNFKPELRSIPMISQKTLFKDRDIENSVTSVLKRESITLQDLKVKEMTNLFFKERERDLIIYPENIKILDIKNNGGNFDMTISFDLKKGSYATIVIKRLILK